MADPGQAAVLYQRYPDVAYYVAQAPGADPLNPRSAFNLRSAFVPAGPDPLPPTMTPAQAWADGGVFVFLGAGAMRPGAVADAVRALVAAQPWTGTRVLWITDPNVQPTAWRLDGLQLYQQTPAGGLLSALTTVSFRNYAVLANGDVPVRLEDGSTSGVPAVVIEPGAPGDVRLSTDSGATELPVVTGALWVPLGGGPAAGCLVFDVQLPLGADEAGHLDALDVGCRFFYDDPELAGTGALTSVRFPVLDPTELATGAAAAASLDLGCVLDPVAPLNPDRSYLTFTGTGRLRSHYRTNLGSVVDVAPVSARLHFASRPTLLAPSDADPLYLVPHGSFSLHPPDVEPAPALMCGLGGAEYVPLADAVLRFVAGQPAYAASFDPTATTGVAGQGPRLRGPVSTSWAALTAPESPVYFAQPEGAALFGHPTTDQASAAAVSAGPAPLPFFEVPVGALPAATDPASAIPYPLVPLAGVTTGLESAARLEVQVLSQQRREVVHGLAVPAVPRASAQQTFAVAAADVPAQTGGAAPDDPCTAPGGLLAATPQGLLATFSADRSRWTCLKMAQSVLVPATGDAVPVLFALQDVVDPLKAALLTNQQFLVVSRPSALAPHVGAHSQIVVANYRFQLDPAQWSRHGTVMIVKNCGKTLLELIDDTNTWVLGTEFNINPATTQAQLRAIAKDALGSDDPLMAPFRAILQDPAWNGVLFLSAYLPLDALPPEIAGLAAGIDPSRFVAHHVGINQTPVGADLTMHQSSIFGLVNYSDKRPLATRGYDFRVASLQVRFANSALADFHSRVRIALNELFGSPVRQDQPTDNVLEIEGSYQRHGSTGAYVFTESRPTTFRPVAADPALRSVRVVQAQFTTAVPPPAAASGAAPGTADVVTSVFSFWGQLSFAALSVPGALPGDDPAPLDLFSYDSLVFADLRLRMTFPSGAPSTRAFALDVTRTTFDVGASVARSQSLAAHFPVTARGLIAGTGTTTPGDLGYITVVTDLDTVAYSAPWFGLVFDLNLGSVGALAAGAGLVATLAVVWAPGRAGLAVSVGLKLPGSTSAKDELTVEGVLKISMFAVVLSYADGAFLLAFDGVALSVFGRALPPGGSFDILVFGDPDPAAGASSLGWYGAYKKDAPKAPPAAAGALGFSSPPA